MTIPVIFVATVLFAAAQESVSLTPDNIDGHGYHLRYVVRDQSDTDETLVHVILRFGRGYVAEDLKPIKVLSLVLKDRVLLNVPVKPARRSLFLGEEVYDMENLLETARVSLDPGNRVHYLVRFTAPMESVSGLRLVVKEDYGTGRRRLIANLADFAEQN